MNHEIQPLVIDALKAAVQQEGESRLISGGTKKPGLLPNKRTKAVNAAKEQCLDKTRNLFNVRVSQEKSGKSVKDVYFVSITENGIKTLFESVPFNQYQSQLDSVAPSFRQKALATCAQHAGYELSQLNVRLLEIRGSQKSTLGLLQSIVKEFRKEEAELNETRQKVSSIVEEFTKTTQSPTVSTTIPRETSASLEEALDFQRDQCEELVYAWKDATETATRDALERVMLNVGLDPVGEKGEIVAFDGRRHITDDPIQPGESAVIVESGWELENVRGKYLIARAHVENQNTSTEATNNASNVEH